MNALRKSSRTSRRRVALLLGITGLVGSGAFALWPVRAEVQAALAIQRAASLDDRRLVALDSAAFRVPLWIVEPAPPTAPSPVVTPPPPPLRLQLLAIVKEGVGYKAAIYDPDSDKLQIVSAGERIGTGRTVDVVNKSSVTIRDENGLRTLALTEAKGAAP